LKIYAAKSLGMTRTHTSNQYLKPAPRKARLSSARDAAKKPHFQPKKAPTSKTTYNIYGEKVIATEVFDTFWWFAAERKSIYDKRTKGEAAP
jgi:hypothetical protein